MLYAAERGWMPRCCSMVCCCYVADELGCLLRSTGGMGCGANNASNEWSFKSVVHPHTLKTPSHPKTSRPLIEKMLAGIDFVHGLKKETEKYGRKKAVEARLSHHNM